MNTLILTEYTGEILSYCSAIEGSSLLSNKLANLIEGYGQLYERRLDLLNGIRVHNREVMCRIIDEYGLTPLGEYIRFRSFFALVPHPQHHMDFLTTSGNVMYLVRLLKRNCYYMKAMLNDMRTITDEALGNDLVIPDIIYNTYINCEKLYSGMHGEIGFLANVVWVDSLSI
jgi:hypothetical protein